MSVTILKTEKPIITISSKKDVATLILNKNFSDEVKNKTVIISVTGLHPASREYKWLNYLLVQSRKLNIDVIFATNDKVWERVRLFATSTINFAPVEGIHDK